eukprot:403363815
MKRNTPSDANKIYTRIQSESKQLTTELRRNRDYYGNGDIFIQKNIDLVNQYLVSMDAYTTKDLKKVCHFTQSHNQYYSVVKSKRLSKRTHMVQQQALVLCK